MMVDNGNYNPESSRLPFETPAGQLFEVISRFKELSKGPDPADPEASAVPRVISDIADCFNPAAFGYEVRYDAQPEGSPPEDVVVAIERREFQTAVSFFVIRDTGLLSQRIIVDITEAELPQTYDDTLLKMVEPAAAKELTLRLDPALAARKKSDEAAAITAEQQGREVGPLNEQTVARTGLFSRFRR